MSSMHHSPAIVNPTGCTLSAAFAAWVRVHDCRTEHELDAALSGLFHALVAEDDREGPYRDEHSETVLWCAPCDDYHPGPSDADRAAEAARHGYGDDDAPDTLRLHTASALAYHADQGAGEAAAAGRIEGGWLI